MPNSYFQFKQFIVRQERAAMKVSTDACLFGAWLARQSPSCSRVLDIGGGTGLLSLMFAQQHPEASIEAIEIDPAAALQAAENFTASPWSMRLSIHTGPVQQFKPAGKYGLVFSNPPFFENHLRSPLMAKNNARHNTTLSLEELSRIVPPLLTEEGRFAVLLPFESAERFIRLLELQGVYAGKVLQVKQSSQHTRFRSLIYFSKTVAECGEEEITIKGTDNNYSPAFTDLLKDYYLYL